MTDLTLKNERLKVVIAVVDPAERDTKRFDTACRAREIVLDGKYSFATKEQVIPGRITANGYGLSAEFSCPDDMANVKTGEWFTKPGVGLLAQLKDGMPFYIFGDYEVKPFKILIDHGEDFVTFTELPETTDGSRGAYPLTITKKLSLKENTIVLETTVKNEGDREVDLSEYQHNFFNANGKQIGPDYKMTVPYAKNLANEDFIFDKLDAAGAVVGKAESNISLAKNEITWRKNTDGFAIFKELTKDKMIKESDPRLDCYYELKDMKEGLSVRESGSFFPEKVVIWGVEHVMCAENFVTLHLAADESKTYTRVWEFNK